MELKDVLEKLENSARFILWRQTDKKSFLAHAFVLLDKANEDSWQIGYYSPSKETITTFVFSENNIEVIEDQEILKTEQKILELQPTQIEFSYSEAMKKAEEFREKEHSGEWVLKKFFIIQQLKDNAVYNITFFFQSMRTLNLKINAGNGEIIDSSIQALMEYDKKA